LNNKESKVIKQWSSRYNLSDEASKANTTTDLGFLKRIRELQLIRKSALQRPRNVDHYVIEARLEPAEGEEFTLFNFLRPLRRLNPYRTARKALGRTEVDQCSIVVQILQGYNFPVRNNNSSNKVVQPVN
jgi:hypothetical protein